MTPDQLHVNAIAKGRTWYNIPVLIKSRTNTLYTAPDKPRHEIRTGVARVCHIFSLSRKRSTREVRLNGRGCDCDGCHITHSTREAVPAKKYYYLELWTKIKEHNRSQRKLQNDMTWYDSFPFWPILNLMFAIVGLKKAPQDVYSYSHVTRLQSPYQPLCGKILRKIVCRIWVASILLYHKLDVWAADSRVVFFLNICLSKD